jgi:hypothetical protein
MSAFGGKADLLKLIFRNAVPVGVTVPSNSALEGAALSPRPGRADKAEPAGYDLDHLLRCDRRNGNDILGRKG